MLRIMVLLTIIQNRLNVTMVFQQLIVVKKVMAMLKLLY